MTIKTVEIREKEYKELNGTHYNVETPDKVIQWLDTARQRKQRIRVFYGNKETGIDWMEEHDTIGTIGRSGGDAKIPLLIKTTRSYGGGGILTDCIVKITIDKQVVYQHEKYNLTEMKIELAEKEIVSGRNIADPTLTHAVLTYEPFENKFLPHAYFHSEKQAERYIAFMKGESNRK